MALRNHTLVFINIRNDKKTSRAALGIAPKATTPKTGLLEGNDHELQDLEVGKSRLKIPPNWMTKIEEVNFDIAKIKTKMKELAKAHQQHLLPNFSESSISAEQTVQILTETVTQLFRDGQDKVKKIGKVQVSQQEVAVKKNVQNLLAVQLQDLSVQFRQMQKEYLHRMQKSKKGPSILMTGIDENNVDEPIKVSFSAQHKEMMDTGLRQIEERTRAITQIANSVNDLAQMFRDLSALVVEQGTILDRIDYNIEATSHNVDQAVKSLVGAHDQQKSYRNKLCMLFLCIGIIVVLVVLIAKGFTKFT